MRIPRLRPFMRLAHDRRALALEAPQQRVDETRRARPPEHARRFDGFRDRRMRRCRAMRQLEKPHQRERANLWIEGGVRPVEHQRETGVELEVPAHGAE